MRAFLSLAQRALGSAALACFHRPVLALLVAASLSVVSLMGVRRLSLDTDLSRLLPDSFQSVQDLNELTRRAGTIGYVVVVLRGSEPEQLRAYARKLAPRLEALPTIRYVDYQRPISWFEDRGLYFLQLDALKEGANRLERRQKWETRKRNPLYLDLEGGEPPPLEFDDLKPEDTPRLFDVQQQSRYYEDTEQGMLVLLARPAGRTTNVTFSEQVIADVDAVLGGLDPGEFPAAVQTELTGRFKTRLDQKRQIVSDLRLASGLALLLSLLYLVVHFRRPVAVFLLVTPLLTGLLWTLGIVGVTYNTLNILTAFMGAILLGLGVDHGIHLLTAFDEARLSGADRETSVREALGRTGPLVFVAGLTTAVGFLGIALAEFRAFREFGVVAALGMIAILVAYLLILPALLGLGLHRHSAVRSRSALSFLVPPKRSLTLGTIAFLGLLLIPLGRVHFNYDFVALEDSRLPSFQLDRQVNRILGYSQTPTLILTNSPEEERQVTTRLRAAKNSRGEQSTIDMIASLSDAIPLRQEEKQEELRRIAKILERVKSDWLENDEQREQLDRLRTMTHAKPFDRDALPPEVLRLFLASSDPAPSLSASNSVPPSSSTQAKTAPEGLASRGVVLIFPAISLSDGVRVPRFAEEVRSAAQGLPVAGESMIDAFKAITPKPDDGSLTEAQQKANAAHFRKVDAMLDQATIVSQPISPHADKFSREQRETFQKLFWEALRQVGYGGSGEFFREAKYAIKSVSEAKGTTNVAVDTRLAKEDLDAQIIFHWKAFGAKLRLVDVSFDGASISLDYQNQFGRIIAKSGVTGLIDAIRKRHQEIMANPVAKD